MICHGQTGGAGLGAADADTVSGSPCHAPLVQAVAVPDSGGSGGWEGRAGNWLIPPHVVQDSIRIRRPSGATAASAATALDPPRHRAASESWKQMGWRQKVRDKVVPHPRDEITKNLNRSLQERYALAHDISWHTLYRSPNRILPCSHGTVVATRCHSLLSARLFYLPPSSHATATKHTVSTHLPKIS